ncbi:hypothetical protein FHU30_000514 [Actinomadura rupiterrae]|nr:hypothetical protein [Actinomadura rupiterrae]
MVAAGPLPHIRQHFTSFLAEARASMGRQSDLVRKHTPGA